MNIFILEDDLQQQSRIEQILLDLIKEHHYPLTSLEVYVKPDQLLADVKEKGAHQLFFLDIEIKGTQKKGLEVAKQIRSQDPYAVIVFVTTHSEYMPLTFQYQVSALDYIDKELSSQVFAERIASALAYTYTHEPRTVAENSFYFKSKFNQIQYPYEDIYYIETSPNPHRVILYAKNERREFSASLSEILKQEKRLLKCHRSFAINPANIVDMDLHHHTITFPNGKSCFVSRRNWNQVLSSVEGLHES